MTESIDVALVSSPRAHVMRCVLLPLGIGKTRFTASILPDRAVLIPEWVAPPERTMAATFAAQFERAHRFVVHELLKQAGECIRGSVAPTAQHTIVAPPTLSDARELVFHLELNGEDLVLHVSATLGPSQFHTNQDAICDVSHLFAAYDAALDYAQEHLLEIEDLGFDTTVLRSSIREWLGYRERMRLL